MALAERLRSTHCKHRRTWVVTVIAPDSTPTRTAYHCYLQCRRCGEYVARVH